MSSRVFVTGASGFVGTAVVEELLHRSCKVVALTHSRDLEGPLAADPRLRLLRGDVLDRDLLLSSMQGCSAVIHLIGIIAERPPAVTFQRMHVDATRAVLDAAQSSGVRRFLHMSALGARPGAASAYHRTKLDAEELVRASSLDWTILRPSLIHGPRGEFMRMEANWARGKSAPYLFMPYFGRGLIGAGGAGKLQPIFVRDVARAFVDCLEKPQTIGHVYEIAGPEEMTWPQLHALATQAITGSRRPTVAVPVWYANLLTRIVPASMLPFNRDQVIMSQENNTCDLSPFRRDFGWEPAAFADTLKTYAGDL